MLIGLAGAGRIGAFHAATLQQLEMVDDVVIADAQPGTAERVAADLGVRAVGDIDALFAAGIDGLVIATATPGHAELLRRGVAAGVPTFCEKPVAATLEETIELVKLEASTDVPIHVGFQRRFDTGYRNAHDAVASGSLGFVHTIRGNTMDETPPAAAYIPTSGGIFRDCNVHDFDALRFVTGREVVSVSATGGNRGADFFAAAGDVDTGAAVLKLDDDSVALINSTRYNGAGHDVRMEIFGEKGAIAVGLDNSLALTSAEEGVTFPPGPRVHTFQERFLPAYRAELAAFCEVVAGRIPSPCSVYDALQAFRVADACELSRATGRSVSLDEIAGAGQ